MVTADEPFDPYDPPPPLCPLHGTELDGEFCEDCWLALYESAWTADDEEDDRHERHTDTLGDA